MINSNHFKSLVLGAISPEASQAILVLGHLPYSHPIPDLNGYLILLLFSCGTGRQALFSATLSALAPHSSGKMEKSGVKFS